MRVLLCGQVEPPQAAAVREALTRVAHAWGVSALVCAADGLPVDGCAALGVSVRTLHDPDRRARLETVRWLLTQGLIDRVVALPAQGDLGVYVCAFDHHIPVWQVTVDAGEGLLAPLSLDQARARRLSQAA